MKKLWMALALALAFIQAYPQSYSANECEDVTVADMVNWVFGCIAFERDSTSYAEFVDYLKQTYPRWGLKEKVRERRAEARVEFGPNVGIRVLSTLCHDAEASFFQDKIEDWSYNFLFDNPSKEQNQTDAKVLKRRFEAELRRLNMKVKEKTRKSDDTSTAETLWGDIDGRSIALTVISFGAPDMEMVWLSLSVYL